jgi:hypothetical protein
MGIVDVKQLKKIQKIVSERLDDGYYDNLFEKFDISKYAGIGLRIIDASYKDYNKRIGAKLHRSHDWESGTGNYQKGLLPGTSTIGLEADMDKACGYSGDKIVVVCGSSYTYGDDPGEMIISGARILDIFDLRTPAGGNQKKLKKNEKKT